MATIKLAKHLPKRCTNEKRKATRQRSYNQGQAEKTLRIAEQTTAEAVNRVAGFTGKMLDNAFRKAFRGNYRLYKRAYQNGELTIQTMIDGPRYRPYVVITDIEWSN